MDSQEYENVLLRKAIEEDIQNCEKRRRVWNRWKRLAIALNALCCTAGVIAAAVSDTEDPTFAFWLAGLVILIAAPLFLAKYYPPVIGHQIPAMKWRLFELYTEVLVKGIAVTGTLLLIAALASIGLEALNGYINRGP